METCFRCFKFESFSNPFLNTGLQVLNHKGAYCVISLLLWCSMCLLWTTGRSVTTKPCCCHTSHAECGLACFSKRHLTGSLLCSKSCMYIIQSKCSFDGGAGSLCTNLSSHWIWTLACLLLKSWKHEDLFLFCCFFFQWSAEAVPLLSLVGNSFTVSLPCCLLILLDVRCAIKWLFVIMQLCN